MNHQELNTLVFSVSFSFQFVQDSESIKVLSPASDHIKFVNYSKTESRKETVSVLKSSIKMRASTQLDSVTSL